MTHTSAPPRARRLDEEDASTPVTVTHGGRGRQRVLLVDDESAVLRLHERMFSAMGFEVVATSSPMTALSLLGATRFELLATDMRMPELSGIDLMSQALQIDPELAAIIVTGVDEVPLATRAMKLGAMDYVTKPAAPEHLEAVARAALRRRAMLREQRRVERAVREEVALRTAELEREQATLRDMTVNVAESLITAMEAKDVYLRGHSHRVAALAAAIGEELALEVDTIEVVRLAGRLHDVGKIGIREAVLNKPGRLTPEEYEHVKQHVRIGMEILAPLTHLGGVLTYVHHHHEHWDGSGYPQGIAGEAISLGGRILTAADAYDALTSARAYRAPLSQDDALAILERASGTLLDAQVFEALARVVRGRHSLSFLDVQ
jgi:response regulator RpfG family c-di-GMP phosphodiesterase